MNRLKHDAGIAIANMLETNATLRVLDLSDNAIDDDAGVAIMEALRHNHSVTNLGFNRNLLGPAAGKELAHCLKRNQVLMEVHCGFNSMGAKRFWKDAEVEEFVEGAGHELGMSLRHNKSLTVLDLEGNRLGADTGDAFAQMMRKNTTLLQLNLGTNEILVEGGRHLANSVSKNKGITYLNLRDNQLGPKAGMAFARSLKDNHVLAHLDLRTNKLGYKAGQAFAIAMMHNTSLISINLENNDFGPNVGKKWATAIQRNVGLTDIDFSNNDLGKHSHLGGEPDELGVMLKRALEANCQLTSLNFSGCHFDSKTFIAVCGAFMRMEALRVLKLDDLLLDEPSTLQLCNALENFPVRILSLARCNIGDSAKAANLLANCLRSLQTLVSLDLSGNILGSRREMNEALSDAFQSHGMQIKELNLSGNRLGPEGGALVATGLGHLHTLEWLDISNNDLDADVCRELAESLREIISFGVVKKECTIKHFEGSNNQFGDEAASELVMAFYNEVTHFIGLQNCNLGPLTGASLGKGLGRPTISWVELNIADNLLGKDGANSIWWSLRKNHSLLNLNMENNKVGPEFGTEEDELGLHGISIDTALERNFTLRHVNMDNNGISAKAGVMFAGSLSFNKGLQNICFQNNALDHVVGEYIGERLEFDKQIVSLNFNGNHLGWEGGKAIANALFTNRFLVSLDLGNNMIGENGPRVGMMFAKAIYQNNVLKSLKLAGNR
jgi:Ran GTPase-activating protein (RanGAP) involved in mRNA processing and transport